MEELGLGSMCQTLFCESDPKFQRVDTIRVRSQRTTMIGNKRGKALETNSLYRALIVYSIRSTALNDKGHGSLKYEITKNGVFIRTTFS